MTRFKYTKDNKEVSDREVEPIGFKFGDRDTVLCIDTSSFSPEEKEHLEQIRQFFLNDLYDAGFSNSIRSFHYDSITEVNK